MDVSHFMSDNLKLLCNRTQVSSVNQDARCHVIIDTLFIGFCLCFCTTSSICGESQFRLFLNICAVAIFCL